MKHSYFTVRELCACGLGAAVMTICTWIAIPLPSGISVTMQTFAVFLITALLGTKLGLTTVLVYLALGAAGVPVFSGMRGGLSVLMGVTGGYLIGFLFTAVVTGLLIRRLGRSVPALILSMVLGLAVCYLFGTIWFQLLYTGTNGNGMAFASILGLCVLPYLLPDAVKLALAVFLVRRLYGHLPIEQA